MFSKSKKLISMLIIFVIVFTYMGQTLEAVATTDGLSAITNGFFSTKQMELNSYFEKDGGQDTQNISDVNEKATLILELSPTDIGKGFLKEGIISATGADGSDANFRFSQIKEITVDEPEEAVEHEVSDDKIDNTMFEEDETIIEEESNEENSIADENLPLEDNTIELEEVEENIAENENEVILEEDQLVNEEEVIQEVLDEEEEEDKLGKYQVDILSDNEIKVQTITARTKIAVEIEYVQKENLDLSDLYKEINLDLSGTFINVNLEEVEQNLTQNINVGWSYSKEIEVSSSYTKFSPYQVGEKQGSILENKIVVKRETEDEKYLPIKNTNIEITVPTLNGEKPTSVSVGANKLMATKGQDTGNVEFTSDNWNYNEEDGKVYISVANENNGTAVNSLGTDEYVVVYKYANFVEEGNYNFETNAIVTAEEYSANENNQVQKEISGSQAIDAVIGEMISYNINTNEEPVNKGKINANYNSEVALYETEFSTTVNLNILTSDMFEELRIDSSKENYLDGKGTAFEATDIYYKKVKFSYNEIKDILANGGSIEILNYNNELLYALNSELITKQEDCEINLESQPTGIFVVLKNVTVNQNLSIEFTKAIQKSNYDKATFNTFRKIESRVSASVKYANEDTTYALSEIAVEKEMKSSMTVANISLNNNNLTTLNENQNVEMRIELNNDKDTSDLYTNPSFEVVFPKYVKNVTVQNINVTYSGGLRIEDFQTYTENDIVKMRINLSGTQNMFSESTITHGTNILVTANITLDDYTPSKKDQIKMYYSNEAVTNYESQTKWTISKEITPGILRETNGFDVEVINFQAPNGLVTANSIVNYDGNLSTVKSIRQGEKVAKINMDSPARITTMELFVSNNTGNTCNNIVLLGRVPFKDNTNVITNENMGTTVDTSMMAGIKEDVTNLNLTTIYYSSNPNANADLSDENNGWTTNVINWQNIKSYMIVVKGSLEAGSVLRYTYDFEVPANLDYSSAIYGSFGAYYHNHSETAIVAETSTADKVALKTEVGIPVSINVTSDVEKEVGENIFINYTVTVKSDTDETLRNIELTNPVPEGTTLYERSNNTYQGNDGYIAMDLEEQKWTIDELKAGETWEKTYMVKVNPGMADKTISNMIHANMEDCTQKSNVHELTVKANSLNIEISKSSQDEISIGDEVTFKVNVTNTSNHTEKNVVLKYANPEELQVNSMGKEEEENPDYQIDKTTLENIYTIPELKAGKTTTIYIYQTAQKATKDAISSKVSIMLEDGTVETSSELDLTISSIKLNISQSANIEENTIKAGDEIKISLNIENVGEVDAEDVNISSQISEYLEPQLVEELSDGSSLIYSNTEQEINTDLSIRAGEKYTVNLKAKVKEDAVGQVISSRWKVFQENMSDLETDEMRIRVIEPQTQDNQNSENTDTGIYSISGTTWVDTNQNGIKDDEDSYGVQAQMQLLKDGTMIKAQTTSKDGSYSFTGLTEGNYTLVSNYDKDAYEATTYANNTVDNNLNSNAYETAEGVAVTDSIGITNSNVENLDIGLVEKDNFDFKITESITKAIVDIKGEQKEYQYDDLDLAKLEINPKDIDDATIKIQYKIRIENVGNINGKVSSIVDYLPNGMYFVEKDNPFWSLGTDGNIYYSGLKDTIITAGDFQDVTLTLQKKMTGDNTGILSNKAKIAYAESETRMTEAKTNNLASQETIVTVTQGRIHSTIIAEISIIAMVAGFGYMIKTGYFKDKKLIKKIYR